MLLPLLCVEFPVLIQLVTGSVVPLWTGKFATASLKTYPPGLCKALAVVWGSTMLRRSLPSTCEPPPEALDEAFRSLHSTIEVGAQIGLDLCTAAQYRPA